MILISNNSDIKCENLLLDENYTIKLIDFGFARKDTMTADQQVILSKTFCGSYAYASPEILKGTPEKRINRIQEKRNSIPFIHK